MVWIGDEVTHNRHDRQIYAKIVIFVFESKYESAS